MKKIRWDLQKSAQLKKKRGLSFEEMICQELIAVKRHPKKPHQKMMLFEYKNYVWVVPYVESKGVIFLKTMFPSRKYTKIYYKERLS